MKLTGPWLSLVDRLQWLATLPERLLAVPENHLTPRFSRAGGLLLLAFFLIVSSAALGSIFVHQTRSDLVAQAAQRLNRIEILTRTALADLESVSGILGASACDEMTLETLTRASMSSVVISRFHWFALKSGDICTPFRAIGDPVTVELLEFVESTTEKDGIVEFLVTPTRAADMLIVYRVDQKGHLAAQVAGALVSNYLAADQLDHPNRFQLRRFDGLVMHDTESWQARKETTGQSEIGDSFAPEVGSYWFSESVDSATQPLTILVWAGADALSGRAIRYALGAASLALLLTAFTIAQINLALQQRASIERRLRIALRKRQFEPVIQPIVDARSGRCLGGEVLMRWRHPARGLLTPVEFLAIAEKTAFIEEMTEMIMIRARDHLAEILRNNPDLYFSFNVTVGQLRSTNFPDWLDKIFDSRSIQRKNIVVELIERDVVDTQTRGTLSELRRRGYRIAIDDFGTGQSSLALLPEIGFDALKIDREFVRSIDEESVNRPVLAAIIDLARQLGVTSIAEGVETRAQHEFLVSRGVDSLQGFLIARPMPIVEFVRWLYSHQHKPDFKAVPDLEERAELMKTLQLPDAKSMEYEVSSMVEI